MAQPKPPMDAYTPPQRLLVPCAGCSCTVLRGVYTASGQLKKYAQPVSPLTGEPHHCADAQARWAPIARYLAGELWACWVDMQDGTEAFLWVAPTTEDVTDVER